MTWFCCLAIYMFIHQQILIVFTICHLLYSVITHDINIRNLDVCPPNSLFLIFFSPEASEISHWKDQNRGRCFHPYNWFKPWPPLQTRHPAYLCVSSVCIPLLQLTKELRTRISRLSTTQYWHQFWQVLHVTQMFTLFCKVAASFGIQKFMD